MKFSTKLLHGNAVKRYENGATLPPISQVSAFSFLTAKEHEKVFAHELEGFAYTRIGNPTVDAFEQRVCELEGGKSAVAFASGMAAISSFFFCCLRAGDEVIASSTMYGGSVEFLEDLTQLGIVVHFVKHARVGEIEPLINEHTRVIYGEVIGNPSLDVMDVKAVAQLAHENGLPLVVDSTTATPYLISPISLGADIVIHSTSKYINGSSNSIGGILIDAQSFDWDTDRYPGLKRFAGFGSQAFIRRLRSDILENMGGCLSPFNAYLNVLGMETMGLRMQRICENADILAHRLAQEEGLLVNYLTLPENPCYELAARQFRGLGGSILTFRAGSREKAYSILDHLKYVSIVSNIGDVRTLAVYPSATIFANGTPQQKEAAGIYEDSIRVSVGIEDAQDLVEDFIQAIHAG